MKYRKTEAKDRQGYVIETRYKSSRGRNIFTPQTCTKPNVRVWLTEEMELSLWMRICSTFSSRK